MRKKIVAGNWKMNKTDTEAFRLVKRINTSTIDESVQKILMPPFPFIKEIARFSSLTKIAVGAQNCSEHPSGAYTGEVSAEMIKSVRAKYVLVGHSERRAYFKETNELLVKKVEQVLANELMPIYCCGEQLEEREKEGHFEVIKQQITEGLFHLTEEQITKCIIAYEPIWAIGTGKTASADQAQEMHAFIRGLIKDKYSSKIADSISILYGGSCNPKNAKELFAKPDIDGGLIGGASLIAQDFVAIANSF